jgi:hypothetical protein
MFLVYDFRMDVSAARKGEVTKENNSNTNQPQLNPLRRLTRAQTRAHKESEQVEFFFLIVGFTQLLTEMSTGNKKKIMFLGSKVRPVCGADCLDNVGSLTSHNPIGLRGLLQG